jgi:hypothetical protein
MSAEATTESRTRLKNPYVGPRPFRTGEDLPNRQEAARELADLVIAERVVLLHAPSGAGKTSLIQAAVVPMLERDGFCPVGPVRVDKPALSDRVRNRYVHSIAQYLLDSTNDNPGELEELALGQLLSLYISAGQSPEVDRSPAPSLGAKPRVLILDQFEEILILNPTDWTVKEQFFDDLRNVLDREPWWVLFAMREDFMGGLDRYLDQIPGHLRTAYRLDFLSYPEADAAVKIPAEAMRVHFDVGAAELLRMKLARVQVDEPGKEPTWLPSPYVEPFQLQVACRSLWKQVRKKYSGGHFSEISQDDVQELDVDQALSRYYSDTVTEVAQATGTPEAAIREWFETKLITITPPRIRSQTKRIPVEGNPDVVRQLEASYLIREDSRGGTTWYELGHDRMITPVLNSNEAWLRNNSQPWQIAAYKWRRNGRPDVLLLSKMELKTAPAPWSRNLTPDEIEFIKRSRNAEKKDNLLKRHRNVTGVVSVIALVELFIIILLALKLISWLGTPIAISSFSTALTSIPANFSRHRCPSANWRN